MCEEAQLVSRRGGVGLETDNLPKVFRVGDHGRGIFGNGEEHSLLLLNCTSSILSFTVTVTKAVRSYDKKNFPIDVVVFVNFNG